MDGKKHEETKKKLRKIGIVLLVIGAAFVVAGFVDFMLATNATEPRMPALFFLIFLGAPMLMIGLSLLVFSYKKEISTYVKNEAVPVINETAEDLKPAVRSVVSAVKEGISGSSGESASKSTHTIKCPRCGEENPAGHKFCAECGTTLVRVCHVCGAEQEADDKFCGKCGAKFD